jgi:peptide/nickel transport system permease protein
MSALMQEPAVGIDSTGGGSRRGGFFLTLLRERKAAAIGLGIILFFVVLAIIAPLISPYSPTAQSCGSGPAAVFAPISARHWLGCDDGGVDMLSELMQGGRISLVVGFAATLVAMIIGGGVGIISGYFGGWVDTLIARTMDIFLAFPLLVFAIALVGVVPTRATIFGLVTWQGNTLRVIMLIFIIGFFSWPYMGRIIRGQTLSLREREFVDAARSLGARGPYILRRELLPNLVGPILVYSTLLLPTNILFEAALSYLGVGIVPPTPSWGQMLSDAVTDSYYYIDPMYMVIPGMAIFLTVMAFNLFGDGLRDALDPKSR